VGRWVVLIIVSLLLQSCASAVTSRQIDQGKKDFGAGNYKQALHELLPAAAGGNAHAQYAVGYMYYYGYGSGAGQDVESGRFWMQKSADQGYPPAVKALQMLK
jgi:TPR repeat protein